MSLLPQDSAPLDLVLPNNIMPGQESESSDKYSEEPDTHHHFSELQEQFQQLQDQLTNLEPDIHPPAHGASFFYFTIIVLR